jgi:DNA-binding NtrC family response regulator
LQAVETEYNKFYAKKLAEVERKYQQALEKAEKQRLEAEAKRLEAERKAFVEKQKKAIIEKAKAKGYSIKEKKVGNKIKLVLVRHTY